MNKQTAYRIHYEELRLLSELSPVEVEKRIKKAPSLLKKDETETEYTIDLETAFSDYEKSMTVTGTIYNTGQWNFDPLTEKLTIKTNAQP